MLIFLIDITLQPSFGHAEGPADSGGRNFFQKKLICKCLFFICNLPNIRIFGKLFPAVFAHKFRLAMNGVRQCLNLDYKD
jgi:hypothetical protein